MASGDLLSVKFNHPTVGSREYNVKGGENADQDLGGYKAEIMVNGLGTGHKSLERKPWSLESVMLEIEETGDQEFLQNIMNDPVMAVITWSHINGKVYEGKGTLTGDLKNGLKDGYASVTLQGVGLAEQIA